MSKRQKESLFIFAGEQSGDLHGSHLIHALKKQGSDVDFEGVGGPRMRNQGTKCILNMEDFEVMGLSDVLWALPKLYKQFYKVLDHILKTSPKATILIDYPGFNLRLAKALRKKGYKGKIVQYVSPSVWAWGKHRIGMMAETLDLLMTIYPFEKACFNDHLYGSFNVSYVGNPLKEYINQYTYEENWRSKIGIPATDRLIALFPGSRPSEIKRNLPILLDAAALYKAEFPDALFGISCGHETTRAIVEETLKEYPLSFKKSLYQIPKSYTYELMRESRSALAKSGTVTLELALHRTPTVAIFKLTLLNRLYAKYKLKLNLPHYCIVNILSKETIFPELIESGLSAYNLYLHLKKLDQEGEERRRCIQGCISLGKILGEANASSQAAHSIRGLLQC